MEEKDAEKDERRRLAEVQKQVSGQAKLLEVSRHDVCGRARVHGNIHPPTYPPTNTHSRACMHAHLQAHISELKKARGHEGANGASPAQEERLKQQIAAIKRKDKQRLAVLTARLQVGTCACVYVCERESVCGSV